MAREANITHVDFPEGFYSDWPMPNFTITHRAATTWPRERLNNEWNRMVYVGIEILKQHYNIALILFQ